MRFIAIFTALAATFAQVGCHNSIYFYETEKFSLTLEGRPDATEPVSLSLGAKQRVAAIVPSKDTSWPMSNDPAKDALSLISFFDLRKTDADGLLFFQSPTMTMETVLLSGHAAAQLTEPQAQRAFKAVAQAPDLVVHLARIFDNLNQISNDTKLSAGARKKAKALVNALNEEGEKLVPTVYPVPFYAEKRGGSIEVHLGRNEGDPVQTATQDFVKFGAYWANLEVSYELLRQYITSDHAQKALFESHLKRTEAERERILVAISKVSVLADTIDFFTDYLKGKVQ